MFHIRPFDTNSRAIFQNAVEHAMAQGSIELRTAGHIAVEERERGGRYAYWMRYNQARKPIKEYIGAQGSDEHQFALAQLDGLKQTAATAKALRSPGTAPLTLHCQKKPQAFSRC